MRFVIGNYTANTTTALNTPGGAPQLPTGNCNYGPNANYISELFNLINAARANAGLPAYILDPEISAFSQLHSEDMAYNSFLSHDGSQQTFSQRRASGLPGNPNRHVYAEIIAIGTPQNAMEQWSRDEHWDFVMSLSTYIGIGYAYNSCSDFGGYFTVNFDG